MPISQVQVAKTPKGKVNPHHPMLNGKLLHRTMEARAKKSQTSAKAQRIKATRKPTV